MRARMFGIGFGEMLVIAIVVVIAVGPDRLPAAMKTVGEVLRQVRRAARDFRASTGIDDLLADEHMKDLAAMRSRKLQIPTARELLGEPAIPQEQHPGRVVDAEAERPQQADKGE